MKQCNNCGAQMPDDATVCSRCETPFAVSRASGQKGKKAPEKTSEKVQPKTEQIVKYQTIYVQQPAVAQPDAKGKAVTSLVLGIVGLILGILAPQFYGIPALLGLVLSIIGIVFGVKARNGIPVGVSGRGIATAGMVCAIIGTVISGIITLTAFCVLVGCWALCASTPYAYVEYTALFSFIF